MGIVSMFLNYDTILYVYVYEIIYFIFKFRSIIYSKFCIIFIHRN